MIFGYVLTSYKKEIDMFKSPAKERGILGAKERWHPTIPKATHSGILRIGGFEIECDVLEDKTRIIRRKPFLKAMGRGIPGSKETKREADTNLPVFLIANNLTPYLEGDFKKRVATINYKGPNNQKLIGYDARLLPEACKIYVQAEHDNVLQENQMKIAATCKAMLYGLATVGIISLVDDATGFTLEREKTELQKILEKYIEEELRQWTKVFPDSFFQQVYRLHGWEYPKKTNHPSCLGGFINQYIYEKLPEGVLEELKKKNPTNQNGNRKHRHHQFLTLEIGEDNLKKQITSITAIMRVSDDLTQFKKNISKL